MLLLVVGIAVYGSIYLQRVAIPGSAVGIGATLPYVGLLVIYASGNLSLRRRTLVTGLILFAALGASALVSSTYSPLSSTGASLGLIVLMWTPFLFAVKQDDNLLPNALKTFQFAMVPISILTILQFALQSNYPQWLDPISLIPSNWLLPGYQAAYEFQYGSGVLKANGVFFVESSFASQYLALGALASLSIRRYFAPLFMIALIMTGGGTGIIMLLIGLAVYVARGSLRARILTIACGSIGLLGMNWLGLSNEILGRAGELNGENTSGSLRFVQPYDAVASAFEKYPSSALWGLGPGSADSYAASVGVRGNFSMIPKLLIEYGIVSTVLFVLAVVVIILQLRMDYALKLPILAMILVLSGALIQAHTGLLLWSFVIGASWQRGGRSDGKFQKTVPHRFR
ncbi:hypothetical protein [Arthrobacter sp. SAFR-044]|uniref:hypothetical protein n=1 Tax=Arthrobacter sp. SAFR-044 TaxID=3387278 RepID=UPI003F7C718E